ncbi:MAG: hypothetical protein ACXADH_13375 [Candidatus Kariarchaeaceae archaeon]|jgi:hypothetical protein
MAVKVWIDGNVVYVDNGVATANPINLSTFFFEKDDDSLTVTLRDSNDGFKIRAPFGDIQDEFGTPIGTYVQVVDFLESIVTQGTIVPLPANAATESTLLDVLSAIDSMRDYEVRLVVDTLDVTWLEVRYWDAQDGTLGAPVYYPPGSSTPGTPTGAVTYINPNTFLAQLVTNTTGLNLEVTQLLVKGVLDTISTSITDGTGTDNAAHGTGQKGSRILGTDGANDQQLKVDSDGNVSVNVLTSTLPTGAATEATLVIMDAVLDAIKLDTANLSLGTTGDTTSVASSITVVTLKASNTSRKSLKIVNDGTKVLYVREGAGATTSLYTWKLEQDEMAIIDDYNGVVTGIWDVANGSAKVTETT